MTIKLESITVYDRAYAPTLFPVPGDVRTMVRTTDPETSQEAAKQVEPNAERDRALALRVLREHASGLTDFELAALTNRQQTSIGKRRGDLVRSGLVEFAGITRLSPSGSSAKVWRAVLSATRETEPCVG